MRRKYYTIVALLVGSHLLTELHTFIMWVNPRATTVYVSNWFLKKGFAVEHLSILWYFKMVEDGLLVASILFSGACQSCVSSYEAYLQWQRYSFRLHAIWLIYFCYHIFDLFMFMYNYKSSYGLYIVVLSFSTAASLLTAFFSKKHFFKK